MTIEFKEELKVRIEIALNELRPHLAVDGGNIELVDVSDKYEVKIRWLGNCEICSMTEMTMKAGVEHTLKQHIPEIQSVEAIN